MRLTVDRDRCMGHAVCALVAPDLMQLDDLGYNITGTIEVPTADDETARRAAGSCPESAISVTDSNG
jgi:ferredoxin